MTDRKNEELNGKLPLSNDFLTQRMIAFQNLEKEYDAKICDRIDYILSKICEQFDSRLRNWWFPGAKENEVGSFHNNYDKEFIFIEMLFDKNRNFGVNNKFKIFYVKGNEKEISLQEKIPYCWLFLDFEDDLAKRKDKYKKSVYDSIMEKLTEEEKNILKEFC